MRHVPVIAAFILGACTTAAVQTAASTPETPTTAAAEATPATTVIALADAEVRTAPSGTARVTILARGAEAFVARLHMEANAAVPQHRDATEEFIHILQGGGSIIVDGVEHELGPGATVYMPANAEVSFQNGPAPTLAVQVFAGPEPAAKYDKWAAGGA